MGTFWHGGVTRSVRGVGRVRVLPVEGRSQGIGHRLCAADRDSRGDQTVTTERLDLGPVEPVGLRSYIDGFNLYYGSLKNTDLKWLDVVEMSRRLGKEPPDLVRFFTARVKDFPSQPGAQQRQDVYLRALATFPDVEVHLGQFMVQKRWRHLVKQVDGFTPAPEKVFVRLPEEKGSDVNLASHLLKDSADGLMASALVFTNDSDLRTPIAMAVNDYGIDITIVNPHPNPAQALRSIGVPVLQLHQRTLANCQLPNPVVDATGREIRRPDMWATA